MTALLLEDDPILSKEIKHFLTLKQIDCDSVFDGELFIRQFNLKEYDIYLLDINVPKINGLDVCKMIRKQNSKTPILMLTAYREIQDKIDAFDYGADDYLVKPFHLDELFLRIKALIRRSEQTQKKTDIITIKDLEINTKDCKVKRQNIPIELTPKEYQLLIILAKAKGRTLSKKAISEQIWDVHFDSNLNTIEVYINFLRKKIDRNFEEKLIVTRLGYGYHINIED